MIGPMEEFGWRGVTLPLLQRRFAPFGASAILGVVWAIWHAPAFLLSGTPQRGWAFGPFLIGVLAISIILTPMFNVATGSLLVAVPDHFQMNGPVAPDAQPWDNVVFAVVAVVIVVACRRSIWSREGAVTEALMPGDEAVISATRPGRGPQ